MADPADPFVSEIFSRIHRSLGLRASALSFELIEKAVDAAVGEFEDLDWKASLPATGQHQLDEFAKDVAAMANTRGGLIVYGVEEERGTGKAVRINPVDVAESTQSRLRALAASRVHPFVSGLRVVALEQEHEADRHGVLVVIVPRSPDAPHAIGADRLGIPYRFGSETHWMRERELSAAYAQRFSRRAGDKDRLGELIQGIQGRVDMETGAWLFAASVPRTPYADVLPRRTREHAQQTFQDALTLTLEIAPTGTQERYNLVRELDDAALNPRRGLGRWIAHTGYREGPDALSDFVYVELHDDGSIGFAVKTDGWFKPVYEDRYQVPIGLIESFVADLTALIASSSINLGIDGHSGISIDLRRKHANRPIAILDAERVGQVVMHSFGQPSGSRSVRSFEAVLGEVSHTADTEGLRGIAATISRDVVNQFGLDYSLVFAGVAI